MGDTPLTIEKVIKSKKIAPAQLRTDAIRTTKDVKKTTEEDQLLVQ